MSSTEPDQDVTPAAGGILKRWWKRVKCRHNWKPEDFADWRCPKCGAWR